MRTTLDEPFERRARPPGRAAFSIEAAIDPASPELGATLREWEWVTRSLLTRGGVGAATRARLEDSRRIVGELARVLAGTEPGEGTSSERSVCAAVAHGRTQAVAALFLCPGAVFVELVATAPWNLLGPGDPSDARAVRGAGTALLAHAEAWSRAEGRFGRLALQAENPRALAVYERLGFARMRPSDAPLALVPEGDHGWSESIRRLASGKAGIDEWKSPWMLLDRGRSAPVAAVRRHSSPASAPRVTG